MLVRVLLRTGGDPLHTSGACSLYIALGPLVVGHFGLLGSVNVLSSGNPGSPWLPLICTMVWSLFSRQEVGVLLEFTLFIIFLVSQERW